MVNMKTSINVPEDVLECVRKHNKTHPDKTINVSGVTTNKLIEILNEYAK